MRRLWALVLVSALGLAFAVPALGQVAVAPGGPDGTDDKVSGQRYVRHDGGTDAGIRHCNNDATNPAPDDDDSDGDADSNDGGSRRQGNEPYSVVDPTDPDTVIAGWNDYCLTDLGAGWQGFAFSRDGGESWTDSMVPGYPQDTSEEGTDSPLYGTHTDAGDPIAAFDRQGNLFVGGIAFNRTGAINGDVYVATYGTNPPANASGYPVDYLRTRIVGRGTPSRNFQGIFQDKPMLEVDRTGNQETDGNVYVCWSRFTGFGQNKIYFSRSTNKGLTFSRPLMLTTHGDVGSVQGCDIAVEHDGDVYVTFRTFDDSGAKTTSGLAFARSTDGGASFSRARLIRAIVPFAPRDSGERDCGDGPFLCPSEFVFARIPLEPRVTADQNSGLDGVYLVYNEIDPTTVEDSVTSYSSARPGQVGQSQVYVVRSLNDGRSWSGPRAVDEQPKGHQFFPDIDALDGVLAVIWQDSRTDPSAASVQLPIGNTPAATSSGRNAVNSFVATSDDGHTFVASIKVSSQGHQPQYEMFGSRDIPFQGDYNWISLASLGNGDLFGYTTWTDNRDVVPGEDPREETQDGFDVAQCRVDLGAEEEDRGEGPLGRRDAPFSGDNCGNAGGLDQNIYGTSLVLTD